MPPAAIFPFKIERELGRGGMGEVYLARDMRLDRQVAIKALPTHLARDPDRLARFQREAKVLASLNHPGIGAIYGLEETEGRQYLILEFVEGRTLADRLSNGPIRIDEAFVLARQIAEAIATAHDRGVIHRDLKPSNVMVRSDGIVKVLDFGLARTSEDHPSTTSAGLSQDSPTLTAPGRDSPTIPGVIMGTAGYMSPEQARGKPVDTRSDIFSFGCVLYEMITGSVPFTVSSLAEYLGAVAHLDPDWSRLPPETPQLLRNILRRCLETEPADRFASAVELSRNLGEALRWAREESIGELSSLCDRILVMEEGRESWTAFELAHEIDGLAPGNVVVERLRPTFSNSISITSDPPGARVHAMYYGDSDGAGIIAGRTPLTNIPFPRGLSRIRLELDGHRTAHDLVWNLSKQVSNASDKTTCTWHYRLARNGDVPDEMERVPGGASPVMLPGLDHMEPEPLAEFLMDRHPVTNRQYKRFLDAGGYSDSKWWIGPFTSGGKTLSRDELLPRLVDTVGYPGPAAWEMGAFPSGEDEHPVTGISWFEAAAYAAWAGKSLPTLFHWNHVAATQSSGQIAPLANFSGRGTVPVGSSRSLNRFGMHDLAGNVREWVLNSEDRRDERYILGGGWNDQPYAFVDAYAQSPLDRSPANGFRCIRNLEPHPRAAILERAISVPFRDFRAESPVPDEVFAYFRRQFAYDRRPLGETVISDQETPLGRWQTIEIAAAYGGERMQVHLYLPAQARPPYQTVVLFPGSLALRTRRYTPNEVARVDFLIKSGRALICPVYKGTFERDAGVHSDYPSATTEYKDHLVMWGKDLGRTIDFIESRKDLDHDRIAYFGVSWGGALGAILPAVETRIKLNILYVAGLCFQRAIPEADQINYVTRVKQPTLMLNGEFDFFFPLESSQHPMFDLLGTPPEHKQRLVYPRGHTVPKTELIRHSLAWLDRYFGAAALNTVPPGGG